MASLKIALFVALCSVVVLGNVVPNTRREHNIDICDPVPTGKKLWTPYYSTSVEEPGKLLQIITKEIKWPVNGESPGKIRCIRITDLRADGTGGYPTVHDGGINFDHLTVHLESQRSHGLLFNIQVLGEPGIN